MALVVGFSRLAHGTSPPPRGERYRFRRLVTDNDGVDGWSGET